jgi:mono/diheme cytochrome c family protein
MKRMIFTSILGTAAALALLSFQPCGDGNSPPVMQEHKQDAGMPEDVQQVFSNSCYDCHSAGSSNVKGKSKLNFSSWNELSAAKKVGKLESISEVVKSGDMPPARYLEKNPDKALSQESKDLLSKWIQEESKKLLGE